MKRRVDQRTLHYEPDHEALAEVERRRADWLEQQLALARLFCRIDRRAAFFPAGCSSVAELASRRGYDGPRARELCRLGYALAAEPALAGLLRANADHLPRRLRHRAHPPGSAWLLAPDDEWIRWARFERLCDLRRRIRRRVESVRQQRPADRPFCAYVTARVAEKVERCREVASQRAGVMLTHGQLLDVLATAYLLEHDALEHGDLERGAGAGSGTRGDGTRGDGTRGDGAAGRHPSPASDGRAPPRPDDSRRGLPRARGALGRVGASSARATDPRPRAATSCRTATGAVGRSPTSCAAAGPTTRRSTRG